MENPTALPMEADFTKIHSILIGAYCHTPLTLIRMSWYLEFDLLEFIEYFTKNILTLFVNIYIHPDSVSPHVRVLILPFPIRSG